MLALRSSTLTVGKSEEARDVALSEGCRASAALNEEFLDIDKLQQLSARLRSSPVDRTHQATALHEARSIRHQLAS